MKGFAHLFTKLDQTNKTNKKVQALVDYFEESDDVDRLWAIALFSGRRPRRSINSRLLREWAAELANVPTWLFEESYHVVGDLAETIALLLPEPSGVNERTLSEWMNFLKDLKEEEESEKKELILDAWKHMGTHERFVFNKLMTGGFRTGVSQGLIVRALSIFTELEKSVISHRLMGDWTPTSTTYDNLLFAENIEDILSRPYPFYLAYPLESEPQTIGPIEEWQAEWKWDGIRSQSIKRGGEWFIWSRGEELITPKFPELKTLADHIPDGTVIDGELIAWKEGIPLSFGLLQTRIGRKNVTKKILQQAPAHIIAYDLLEWKGEDIRSRPFSERRKLLGKVVEKADKPTLLTLSEQIEFTSWEELAEMREFARDYHSEGFMLKHKQSDYKVGRKRGDWWKWKVDPLTIDGVMIYAQRGHGRRANLYSDYTFAVWDQDKLVPFAKAYSGLTDEEMRKVDAYVKKNTLERFGPVRSVTPQLVFEIGFEGIRSSPRHKSGVAVRFPRILKWRSDKKIEDADTLETLQNLLMRYG